MAGIGEIIGALFVGLAPRPQRYATDHVHKNQSVATDGNLCPPPLPPMPPPMADHAASMFEPVGDTAARRCLFCRAVHPVRRSDIIDDATDATDVTQAEAVRLVLIDWTFDDDCKRWAKFKDLYHGYSTEAARMGWPQLSEKVFSQQCIDLGCTRKKGTRFPDGKKYTVIYWPDDLREACNP